MKKYKFNDYDIINKRNKIEDEEGNVCKVEYILYDMETGDGEAITESGNIDFTLTMDEIERIEEFEDSITAGDICMAGMDHIYTGYLDVEEIEIGNNIKSLLENEDISIRKMSIDLGMDYSVAYALVNRESLATTSLERLIEVSNYLKVDIKELYTKEEAKMIKEKYEMRYEELVKESNYKYFIVGSPTSLNIVEEVKGDSLKEIWNRLLAINEIDIERYDLENEIFNEETEVYSINEPSNYKTAIEEYLKDSNNFYYKKHNW